MKLNVFEAFAGIGAQHKALKNLNYFFGKGFDIKGISEWNMFANRTYLAIHGKKKDLNPHFFNRENIEEFIFSENGKEPIKKTSKRYVKEKEIVLSEYEKTNNIGSIVGSSTRYKYIPNYGNINLLTYSFPCQDLSSAGNFHGFNKGVKEGTRSGLLLEIEKLIDDLNSTELPKYLLMENVPNLTYKKHMPSFNRWMKKLKEKGYSTYWGILDSSEYGTIQRRKRVFAVSVKDGKDIISKGLKEIIEKTYNDNLNYFKDEKIKKIIDFKNKYYEESLDCLMKMTPSRTKMIKENKQVDCSSIIIPSVTTKQDRHPNCGYVKTNLEKEGFYKERLLTPRECWKLMGFSDNDYEKATSILGSKEKMYRQAGNSIVVRVLELIFLSIFEGEFENVTHIGESE